MEHFLLSSTTVESAQKRAAEFEATGHGRAFAEQLRNAKRGRHTIGAEDLKYIRDLIDSCAPLYDILTRLYSLGYERGQNDGPDIPILTEGGTEK